MSEFASGDGAELDEWVAARERRRAEREQARARRRRGARGTAWLRAAVGLLALATLVGLAVLWPAGRHAPAHSHAMGGATQPATVTRALVARCPGPVAQRCDRIVARLGPGRTTVITLGPVSAVAPLRAGTRIRDQRAAAGYVFAGVDRRRALLGLALAFALMLLVLARLRGLLALAGLAVSLLLAIRFVLPALLDRAPALPVALVGSLAVMFVTVMFTYGVSATSLAACLGIAGSLVFAALAGTIAVHAAALDGRSSDLATYLATTQHGLSLRGIVLVGLVVGALGVLADMGVTQASTVMALRQANPALGARALFRSAFAVGRDHLVATTHTLVLAYLGATLPLLLALQASGVSATDAIDSQDLAEPIVVTLVGAMALLVSVPVTTGLCALVAHRLPPQRPGSAHSHHH
jgi:uncharacterized membrane protein